MAGLLVACKPGYGEMQRSAVMLQIGESGAASGTLIGNNKILTAGHVYDGAQEILAAFANGQVLPVRRLWRSDVADIAILEVKYPRGYRGAEIDCDPVRAGDEIWVVGGPRAAPFHIRWAITHGYVSTLATLVDPRVADTDPDLRPLIALDVTGWKGNSGGPVFNDNGEVIGILTAGVMAGGSGPFGGGGPVGIGLMTPASEFCRAVGL